jgi:UDP-glucose 4-epimerase
MKASKIGAADGNDTPGRNVTHVRTLAKRRPINETRNIPVTGGAGCIGSHACKALAAAGSYPVTLDHPVSGHRRAIIWGPLIAADLNDRELLVAVMDKSRLAAAKHISELQVDVENTERRPGGPDVLVADRGESAEILEWSPRFFDLNPLFSTALRWYSKQKLHRTPKPGREAIA